MGKFNGQLWFTFRGKQSMDYGYGIVSVNDDESGVFGLNRTPKEGEGLGDINYHRGVKNEYIDLDLTIAKISRNGDLLPMTDNDKFELRRWFFQTDSYEYLNVNGINYSVLCVGGEDKVIYNGHRIGYVNLKFKCHPTAYSNDIVTTVKVSGSKTVELLNKTNVIDKTYPIIKFVLTSGNSVTITNLSNGQKIKLNDLKVNNEYEIFNAKKFATDNVNGNTNMYVKNEFRSWVDMVYGINRIKIEGNGEFQITYKYKLCY